MIGCTVLLFDVRSPDAFAPEGGITLLYGGRLGLIWHSRITAFYARPHGTLQPAAGSLMPSDQDTNLSLLFES